MLRSITSLLSCFASYHICRVWDDTIFQTNVALIWGISNCLPYRFLAFTSYLTTENTHSSTREISVRLIGKHLSRVPSFVPAACHPALLAACQWSFTGSGVFLPHRISSRPCRWLLSGRWFLPLAPKCHTNNKYLQIVGMSNRAYRPGQRMKRLAWQRRRPLTHDLPELMGPTAVLQCVSYFTELLYLCCCWQQMCTSILLFPGSTDIMLAS